MSTEATRPVAVKLYERYEYLASAYASKLWNFDRLGMTYDDVVQEFKMKIWYSVDTFLQRWKSYRETGKFKPVPLKFYIQSNLRSLIIDLSKKINSYVIRKGEMVQQIQGIISIDEMGFDIGKAPDTDTIIDWERGELIVHGINLLEGLSSKEASMFSLFLRGQQIKTLKKVFKGMDVSLVIKDQMIHLRQKKTQLLADNSPLVRSYDFELQD